MARTKSPPDPGGSTLLLTEYFDAGDERFLAELYNNNSAKKLQFFAPKWYGDARPFAREALLAYISEGCDRPHHRALVKKLFKLVESAADDEAMAHFVPVFDRIAVRKITAVRRRIPGTYKKGVVQLLRADPTLPNYLHEANRQGRFTMKTRRYLQRRAWRYFRYLSYSDPVRYVRGIGAALLQYTDAQFEQATRLLDAWSLCHALYWSSPVLSRPFDGVQVARGRSLAELETAPYNEEVWAAGSSYEPLFALLTKASCALVRAAALSLLEKHHAAQLTRLSVAELKLLLKSPYAQPQSLGAKLLEKASGLERLTLAEWLDLLSVDNPFALPILCKLVVKHVAPSRATLAQCVALACSRPAPVAELGLLWLREKSVASAEDLESLTPLRDAPAKVVRGPAVQWLLSVLDESPHARPEHVRELIDSRHGDVRIVALEALAMGGRFAAEPSLWSALSESPYDDVRGFLLAHLQSRLDAFEPESIRHVWASVLLAVHRGSRAKQKAITQVATRVASDPSKADDLLPLLALALRSVRAPERRGALAAITVAAMKVPSLRAAVGRHIPELLLPALEAAS